MNAAVEDRLFFTLRQMRQRDIDAVWHIESDTYDFPWSRGIFRDCLLAGYCCVVVDHGGQVMGYGIMSVAAAEAHLLNICLAGPLRGKGNGQQLLGYLMRRARRNGAERIYLEVRPSNKTALRLYRREGFEVLGVRKNYYKARHGSEDAVVLTRGLVDDPA